MNRSFASFSCKNKSFYTNNITNIQQLFPYPWLAAGVLITALMAAIFARLFPAGLIIAGVVTLVLAWLNVWRAVSFQRMAKIALLGSLFAVVSLALTEPLSHVGINVYVPMGGGILLATLATGACTFWIWLSKTNRMV